MTGAEIAEFLIGALAMLALPGPSVLFLVTRTLREGRSAGLVSVLGLEVGLAVHVAAAALGLTVALASSPVALEVLRAGGAAYLAWLGVGELRHRTPATGGPRERAAPVLSRRQLFRDAFAIDALNPQTALFVLAFLPRFVDADHGFGTGRVALLGVGLVALAAVCDTSWVLLASTVNHRHPPGGAATLRRRLVPAVVNLVLAALVLVP